MNVDTYLERIGYRGARRPNLETLFAIHRAHLTAIPYENLDIHLGRALGLEIQEIYDKIVERGRGGWCYEMNSLLTWALREVGFDVTQMGAAVGPENDEDRQHMDHMILCVMLDEPWLLDVGFGNAFLEPLPLREGSYQQAHLTFRLARNGDYWSFHNHAYGGPGFEFLPQARTLNEYAARCRWLQTSPDSGFVKTTVCHRLEDDHTILSLRGAVLTTVDASGKSQQVIESGNAYAEALTKNFRLQLTANEIDELWAQVWPRHLAWVESQPVAK